MQGITKLSINYTASTACKVIIEDHLKAMSLGYDLGTAGSITIRQMSEAQHAELNGKLSRYGIELTEEAPKDLVEQIKRAVIELVGQEEGRPNINISDYLSKRLNYSYGYLTADWTNVFDGLCQRQGGFDDRAGETFWKGQDKMGAGGEASSGERERGGRN